MTKILHMFQELDCHQKQYIFHEQRLIIDLHMNYYIKNQFGELQEVYSIQPTCKGSFNSFKQFATYGK